MRQSTAFNSATQHIMLRVLRKVRKGSVLSCAWDTMGTKGTNNIQENIDILINNSQTRYLATEESIPSIIIL